MSFSIKYQRAELKEMGADENDPRVKALNRIEERQKYDMDRVARVTQTNTESK